MTLTLADRPDSRLKWIRTPPKFLWSHRTFPPLSRSVPYVLLELWFVVYDQDEGEHAFWIRRVKLGREVAWRDLKISYDTLLKRLGAKAVERMSEHPTFHLGIPWREVASQVQHHVKRQLEFFDQTQYVNMRDFVGWTVYPAPLWAQRLKPL